VIVMLYVPGVAGVVIGFVPPPPPLPPEFEVLAPQPTAPIAATDNNTASKVPRRRRLGTAKNRRHASVAPDPAAYHGARPIGFELVGLFALSADALVVVTVAVRTNDVVALEEELITTGLTENE
jgi:hypothetical protein